MRSVRRFKATFDSVLTDKVMLSPAEISVPTNVFNLLITILQKNEITIDDGMAEPLTFVQRACLAQIGNHLAEGLL